MNTPLSLLSLQSPGLKKGSDCILPGYDPQAHDCGIVHLGVGAFHKAHQAVYTDGAIAKAGGDWRIIGVNLRSRETADRLNAQDGLYTVIESGGEGKKARIIASIKEVIPAAINLSAVLVALTSPKVRIVTLTVTEKAYGIERARQAVDPAHPSISNDLANPRMPKSVLGLLTEAIRLRHKSGIAPFTVLCCDNLPANGKLLRAGLVDFATRCNRGLGEWISSNIAFPSSMVDRITPAPTRSTIAAAQQLTGLEDLAAVETEPFMQWVIEDNFTNGRPEWEAAGALFIRNVEPYEMMKLRMLNGAHSMLAYGGFLAGLPFVRDVMKSRPLALLVERHMRSAQLTLPDLPEIDLENYRRQLIRRFENPAIAHETAQIAMDGTQKLPQRIFAPALDAMNAGQNIRAFAFATACWMRYALGRDEAGKSYELRDPLEGKIRMVLSDARSADDISKALFHLDDLFPTRLIASNEWCEEVIECLGQILDTGMAATIEREARQAFPS